MAISSRDEYLQKELSRLWELIYADPLSITTRGQLNWLRSLYSHRGFGDSRIKLPYMHFGLTNEIGKKSELV